jgi:hypothetical protein
MGARRGETRGAGKTAQAQAHGKEPRRKESLDPLSGWLHPHRDDFGVPYLYLCLGSGWKTILIYKHAIKTIEEVPSLPNP